MAVNYGLNKVRFPAPVPAGSRVQVSATLADAEEVAGGGIQATIDTVMRVEGPTSRSASRRWSTATTRAEHMTHAYDPELAPWAPAFAQLSFADIPAARAGEAELLAALPPYDPPVPLDVDELLVPGPEGAPEVRVRRYRPADHDGPLPALVYVHGGGFVVGSLDLYDADCRRIAAEVGAVVFSVDYRLAPGTPVPGRARGLLRRAGLGGATTPTELGVDPDRIAIGGESAGGGLAAGVALLARDRGGPRLCLQFLGIPELDDRLDTESMRTLGCRHIPDHHARERRDQLGQLPRARVCAGPTRCRRTPHRHAPPTSPACRPRWSRRTSSTRSATRTSPTRSGCCRPGCRPSCTSTPGPSTRAPGSRTLGICQKILGDLVDAPAAPAARPGPGASRGG